MQRIRVLNILLDGRISGPARRILEVGARLRDKGVETTLVIPEGQSDLLEEAREKGVRILQLPLRRVRKTKNPIPNLIWICSLLPDVVALARRIRKERIDIVHCNGLAQIIGGLAGKKAGVRVMWHLNDVAVPIPIQKIFKPIVQRNADLIVFSSQAVQSHFGRVRQGLPKGILYAPVDTSYYENGKVEGAGNRIREDLGILPGQKLVGMVANINYLKGVPDFVRAARIVHEEKPEVRFVHVGARLSTKKSLYQEVENDIRRLGLTDTLFLSGARSNVRDFLAAMDIFVIPSISEACPVALLEAMAMEKPIVATRVGGIPELVRDAKEALLVPVHSPGKLAEKVLFCLDHPDDCIKMGRAARARAVKHFDIDRCVSEHERYYRTLAG